MRQFLVSRSRECAELQHCLDSDRSELVIIHGRRRVGKTYLIDNFFNHTFDFTYVGEHNTPAREQIVDFVRAIERHSKAKKHLTHIRTWYDAFRALEDYLETITDERKKVIFIDEMPWMDTQRSNFVSALENFWNGWANRRTDIMLIATGSATSWMADKLIANKGGLHARITCNLRLAPFNLHETEEYLRARNFSWEHYQILQCYMLLGGVPFYLSLLNPRLSLAQNIDTLFFAEGAPLHNEFDELYTALFNKADLYIAVAKLLAEHRNGLSREEIVRATGTEGAVMTKVLKNLIRCDFVTRWAYFGNKKRDCVYRLNDFFTLFYYKFIESNDTKDENWWTNHMTAPGVNAWMGISFELVCLLHHQQIKKALGISGMATSLSTWRCKADEKKGLLGGQIDLIIERADHMIHLCEMKFSQKKYNITAEYEEHLRERMWLFDLKTHNNKPLVHTFVTTYGLGEGKHHSIVHSEVTMDDLFRE